MSLDKIEEYRAAFSLFDPDNRGTITTDNLRKVLNESFGQSFGDEDLQYMLRQFLPGEGASEVDFPTFALSLHSKMGDPRYNEAFGDAFDLFDTQKGGELSKEDLVYGMAKLGERLTDAEADEMLKVAKKKDDFVRVMSTSMAADLGGGGGGGGGSGGGGGGGGVAAAPSASSAPAPAAPGGGGGGPPRPGEFFFSPRGYAYTLPLHCLSLFCGTLSIFLHIFMAHNTRTHTHTISPFFCFFARNQAHLHLVVDPLVLDPLEHLVVVLQDLVDLLHPLVDLPDLVDPLVLRVPLGHQGHLALLVPLGLLDHPRKKMGVRVSRKHAPNCLWCL